MDPAECSHLAKPYVDLHENALLSAQFMEYIQHSLGDYQRELDNVHEQIARLQESSAAYESSIASKDVSNHDCDGVSAS